MRSTKWILLLLSSLFLRDSERSSDLSKATKLVYGRTENNSTDCKAYALLLTQ